VTDNIYPFNPMKILCYSDRLAMDTHMSLPYPITLNLDLTNICNQDCKWCYVKEIRANNRVSMEKKVAERILSQFKYDLYTKTVLFTGGGEPTVHPDFIDIVAFANKLGYKIGLTTNGTMLSRLAEQLAEIGPRYVRISIDASSATTYAKLHRCGINMFDVILNGARRFSRLKGDHCDLGFAFLVTPENCHEVGEAIKIAEDLGFDYISFRPSVFGHKLTISQCNSAINLIDEYSENCTIKVYTIKKRFEDNVTRHVCRSTPLVAVVTADAKLNLCCQYRGRKEWQWGNLIKKPLIELWGNKEHIRLLDKAKNIDCPKCRMIPYNEIIQRVFIDDEMHKGFI
jgi:GTP 3',8-cyclase